MLSVKAMRFALGIASEVIAVQVLTGDREVEDLTGRWDELAAKPVAASGRRAPALVILRSEYRQLYAPLVEYVTRLEAEHPGRPIAVVVPELVERRWYHQLLHNHTATMMRALLLLRGGPQTVIVNVPWYLGALRPELEMLRRHRPRAGRR